MTARARCASCDAVVRATDRFCSECGTPIAAAQAAPVREAPAPPESASLQVPAASARALAEQRKVVTILFADLSGSTPLAEKLDPEDLREILGRYFNTLARQIQRYEGTIDKYIGDAIMCVFGAPISHEDDAERAIRAALAMQGAISRLNDDLEREHGVRLALRIGINTGEVVAGLLGGDVQRAYTVVGDAVNTAQRFESVAPLNEVLVSDSTRRLAAHAFEFETLPPVTLKGKSAPVAAYRVLRPRDEEIPPEASPLVGRQAELDQLRAALADALGGSGRCVAIVGEAGVGKSRLTAEFKAGLAAGIERLSGRCTSYETNTPFALLADLVRGAFRIGETDNEPTARTALIAGFDRYGDTLHESAMLLLLEVLGYGERSPLEAERKRALLIGILRSFLSRAAERVPFVIAAEDLHWADLASVAVLAELARDVLTLPCLFITTARPGWDAPWDAEVLQLEPLGASDARRLVEEILDETPGDDAIAAILERTGGNPFFIEELVRSMREVGAEQLPQSVQEVVEARIERLPDGPSRALQAAAVIGVTFWYRVLERLLPDEQVFAHVAELEQEAFVATREVRPELTYAFRQSLLRDVAYQTQLLATRRRMHRAVGEVIEELFGERADEFTDFLAYHYRRGDDNAKATTWLLRAGRRAQRLYANAEALDYLRDAAARSEGDTRAQGVAHEGIGDVLHVMSAYDDAIASYATARDAHGEEAAEDRARLLRKTGVIQHLQGLTAIADQTFETVLRELPAGSAGERARALFNLGEIHWRSGEYAQAIVRLTQALTEAERARDDDARAEALKQLGTVHVVSGDLATGLRHYLESLALYERLGDVLGQANVHSNIGLVRRRESRHRDAIVSYERALAIRERIGDQNGVFRSLNNLGEAYYLLGDLDAAAATFRRAHLIADRIGYATGVALARLGIGATLVQRGDAASGIPELLKAVGEFEAVGNKTNIFDAIRDLTDAYLEHAPGEAGLWAERALQLAEQLGAADKRAIALQLVGRAAAAAGESGRGAALLEASRELLLQGRDRQELARTLAALARAYEELPADDARRAAAASLREEARAIFVELGASLDLRRLERSAAR